MSAFTPALISLAAKAAPATKVAAKAALKAAGLKQTLADDLLAAVDLLKAQRTAKKAAAFKSAHKPTGRAAVRLPQGTPQLRLDGLRRTAVEAQLQRALRVGQHDTVAINLTRDPAKVGIVQVDAQDWDFYKGSYKGRPMNYKSWTVTVPADWRLRVLARSMALVDGLMTLDAAPVEVAGCELFAATWLVQGRGNIATASKGYIARSGGISYHAATIDQALTGISRKSRALAMTAMLAAADLGELVAKCSNLQVSVADARLIGACEYGIESWCNAVGLPYDAGSAPIADVYAAYQREPRPEARAAILHALRRARHLVAN